MPEVLNRYKMTREQKGVYIGRSGPFGNPFEIPKHGNRDEVCDKYDAWIAQPEQTALREQIKKELKGKNLICFCKQPFKFVRCHGDTVLKIANED